MQDISAKWSKSTSLFDGYRSTVKHGIAYVLPPFTSALVASKKHANDKEGMLAYPSHHYYIISPWLSLYHQSALLVKCS